MSVKGRSPEKRVATVLCSCGIRLTADQIKKGLKRTAEEIKRLWGKTQKGDKG